MAHHPVIALHPAGPDEAMEGPTQPSRRALVKWLAAAAALAASGCSRAPEERIYSYAHMPEIEANGTPSYYASACLRDGFAQGVLIGTQQGRPVKVEGNPGHPASLGGTDAITQAEILQLWDPERSTEVWRDLGQGRAAPSSWRDFDAAWAAWSAQAAGAAGAGLHVLAAPSTSPTEAAQLAALLRRFPAARWYRDDADGAGNAQRGAAMAFGRPVRALHRFDRAQLVVAFGGDPFGQADAGVRHAADWARARGAAIAEGRAPSRALALETTPGLFGARADERWAMPPPAIEAVLWHCAAQLLPGLPPARAAEDETLRPIAERVLALLKRYPGRTMLSAGATLSPESHAIVHALNRQLDGECVEWIAAPDVDATLPAPGTLAELTAEMQRGAVGALLVLGGNPAYTAPAALGFGDALARVPFSAHLALHRDETSRRCRWHLPCGHVFEQWGDARAFDGTATILQPAIAPLYDTRSPIELLASMAGDGARDDGHALVRAHWQAQAGSARFDDFWRDALRNGVVAGTRAEPLAQPSPRPPERAPEIDLQPETLWGVFPLDAAVGDGSHANNGWLQELPRPFTSITWGNALHLGPATARKLGLRTGDVAGVRAGGSGGAAIEVPVWVQPGHAEQAATLPRGYGRRAAGSVGDGVGVDSAALRSADGAAVALRIERTGRRHDFALTQIEMGQQGRELARVKSLAELRAPPAPEPAAQPTLYPPEAREGHAWAMAIDLDACIGCNACTVSCQAENNIPVVGPAEVRAGRVMHWIRIDAWRDDTDRVVSQPVPCMHCENAPCELVCPVGATLHDSEGLNVQVYNRCVGTRFCSNNCPYKVRRFNFRQYSDVTTETLKLMRNPEVTVRSRGVMEKCSYCVQRLSHARREEQKTGRPLPTDTVRTACQSACPTQAIRFGDLADPASDVVRARASPRHYAMLGELGTRPRTTYLARIDAFPKEDT
jgi:molybdopterin-containing oxidoreductase family iron-sulfur binding subunit